MSPTWHQELWEYTRQIVPNTGVLKEGDGFATLKFKALVLLIDLQGGQVVDATKIKRQAHIQSPCFVIWEDQWKRNSQAVKDRLLSLAGKSARIHARETESVKLNQIELDEFLNKYHLAGSLKCKYKIGLKFQEKVVAAAGFGKLCPVSHSGREWNSIELKRFCNVGGHTVVGGLSKLIKTAAKVSGAEDIMTYADLDWAQVETWTNMGFIETGKLEAREIKVDLQTWNREYKTKGKGETISNKTSTTMEGDSEGGVRIQNSGSVKYNLAI